ncbi:hypothetical protein KFL_003780180 [Klebsormidium nitens]|uniref:Uncharacterized protein n=1 Tax=Klebsormidium nitens TaxID=105231 RepID=A0A1Y1ICY8_KLENI|nr:hypothetical protein KFL_003780180 [Klebsormidium nitens]|eukprot:GAQ87812.1 hypothetical protein KFL_003780180 [Klebsormidium nitens]
MEHGGRGDTQALNQKRTQSAPTMDKRLEVSVLRLVYSAVRSIILLHWVHVYAYRFALRVVVPEGKLWKFTKSKGRKMLFSAAPQLRSTKGLIDEKAAQVIALPPDEGEDEKLVELDRVSANVAATRNIILWPGVHYISASIFHWVGHLPSDLHASFTIVEVDAHTVKDGTWAQTSFADQKWPPRHFEVHLHSAREGYTDRGQWLELQLETASSTPDEPVVNYSPGTDIWPLADECYANLCAIAKWPTTKGAEGDPSEAGLSKSLTTLASTRGSLGESLFDREEKRAQQLTSRLWGALEHVLWFLLLVYIAASALLWMVALFTAACAMIQGEEWRLWVPNFATAAVLLVGFLVDAKERANAPARSAIWGFAYVGYGWRVALVNLLMMVTFLGMWLEWDARTWVPSRLASVLDSL